MADYFKKRRAPSPNKNEAKVQRGKQAAAKPPSLGQRYPGVEHLAVSLEFINPKQPTSDREDRAFGPADACDFSVDCPGRCGHGTFDLASKINSVIEAREALSEASGVCQEPLYAQATESCGLQLKCRIEVRYAS